jgi:hypothetical protein
MDSFGFVPVEEASRIVPLFDHEVRRSLLAADIHDSHRNTNHPGRSRRILVPALYKQLHRLLTKRIIRLSSDLLLILGDPVFLQGPTAATQPFPNAGRKRLDAYEQGNVTMPLPNKDIRQLISGKLVIKNGDIRVHIRAIAVDHHERIALVQQLAVQFPVQVS